jgi:hypothetical protein
MVKKKIICNILQACELLFFKKKFLQDHDSQLIRMEIMFLIVISRNYIRETKKLSQFHKSLKIKDSECKINTIYYD